MKKIIVIENNRLYYQIAKDICWNLDIPIYPHSKDEFEKLSSCFSVALARPGAYKPEVQHMRIDRIRTALAEYIGDTEDVLCICDYRLSPTRPEGTGTTFYEKFLDGRPVIFISSVILTQAEENLILKFCAAKEGRVYIRKDSDDPSLFKKVVTELIKAFLRNNEEIV